MFGLVGPANLAKLYPRPALAAFAEAVRTQDRAAAANWITLAFVGGDITDAERTAILAKVSATVPDPDWPAQISWSAATLGRPVDAEDVAASRPGG